MKNRSIQISGDSREFEKNAASVKQFGESKRLKAIAVAAYAILMQFTASAQDGNAGISQATTQVRSYFDTGTQLMYAIGAVLGLVGAVKVFQKWNGGDPDTGKVAAA